MVYPSKMTAGKKLTVGFLVYDGLQEKTQNRFGDLVVWIANNLQEDLCIERLAARVFLGERQFRRVFNQTFGESPGLAVERIRIDVAQVLLTSKSVSIEQISVDTGF